MGSEDNNKIGVELIHNNISSGMSRRRLLRQLSAAGFTGASLTGLTVDDVQAAASNQVPIVVGHYREDPDDPNSERIPVIKNVASDWYNSYLRAIQVKEKISPHLAKRDGVAYVGVNAKGRSNIIVGLLKEYLASTMGAIPERVDGVDIEVREAGHFEEQACDTDTLRTWDDGSEVPGSIKVTNSKGNGTLGGPIYDYYSRFITAFHVFPNDSGNLTNPRLNLHNGTKFAEVIDYNCAEDWAVCKHANGYKPKTKIKYSGYSALTGNFSKAGVADLQNNGNKPKKVGQITCRTTLGEILGVDMTIYVAQGCVPHPHQVLFQSNGGDMDDGDSGSMSYFESPNNSSYCWGVSLCNYQDPNDQNVFGVALHRLNDHGYTL